MPSASYNIVSYLRMVAAAWREDTREDAELLARFAEARDEAAFATLVWRHGPLVWRTCRHILGETSDAEDVFQSTFLALALKAGRFPVESLAGWLHRTARRAALDAQLSARRRQGLEQRLRAIKQSEASVEGEGRTELCAALDEELAGLPEKLRVPLLLHYLEGRSQVEVARLLGCGRSVLQRRLTRGEAILRERLERRGLGVGIGSVAVLLGSATGTPAVPARLISSTARAAVAFRSGTLIGGAAEAARLGALAASSLGMTMMRKSLWIMLACCLGLGSATLFTYRALSARPDEAGEAGPAATQALGELGMKDRASARIDCYGDPLPGYALARMGTARLWRRAGWWRDNTFAFSPDGKTLATHIEGMTVCLWNAATGKEIRRLTTKTFEGVIHSLGFSRDGKTLVTVNWDQTVSFWEVATGKFLRSQGPKRDNVLNPKVAFLPDGQILGFADFLELLKPGEPRRGMYVWDGTTGKEICQLGEPRKRNPIAAAAFSPDGKLLATVTNGEKIIHLWEVATGKKIRQLTTEDGQDGSVVRVAFSPDEKTLASTLASGDRKKICVWEIATGKKIHLFQPKEGGRVSCDPLTYSPNGKTLVGGGGHLWDIGTGKEIYSFGCQDVEAALFSPDGKVLAMGDWTGAFRLWELATGKEIGPRKGFRGPIRSVAYSPDGKTLASLSGVAGDKTIRLWEAATGKEMRPLAKNATCWGSGCIAYSPDGKMLVSLEGKVLLCDTSTGKEIRIDKNRSWTPRAAAFSPDGRKLAACTCIGDDNMIRLWELATGKEIYSLPTGVTSSVEWSIAFSPDGRLLAAPGKENTVSLWWVATGTRIGQLGGPMPPAGQEHRVFVRHLAFSPDSRMLATSSCGDDKIHLWEVTTGKEIYQLDGWRVDGQKHCPDVYPFAFSLDGRILATAAQGKNSVDGSIDPKVHLWEVASGKEIGQLRGHQAIVRSLAFSPDGKTLASGSDDLTCLVWDVTSFASRLKSVRARPLPPQALSREQLETAWADLAQDPAKAYAAIWTLQAVPTQAIALLQARVRPVAPPPDPQQLKRWIADLDADKFAVREKAQRGIRTLGEAAIPALRQALQGRPALEVKRRLQDLLARLEPPKEINGSPRHSRELWAVKVLELIGTVEARQVLQAWTQGVAGARLTVEAEAALARLTKRTVASP